MFGLGTRITWLGRGEVHVLAWHSCFCHHKHGWRLFWHWLTDVETLSWTVVCRLAAASPSSKIPTMPSSSRYENQHIYTCSVTVIWDVMVWFVWNVCLSRSCSRLCRTTFLGSQSCSSEYLFFLFLICESSLPCWRENFNHPMTTGYE